MYIILDRRKEARYNSFRLFLQVLLFLSDLVFLRLIEAVTAKCCVDLLLLLLLRQQVGFGRRESLYSCFSQDVRVCRASSIASLRANLPRWLKNVKMVMPTHHISPFLTSQNFKTYFKLHYASVILLE